jgi:DNA-binding HxlR family transcriptional regulator
VTCKLQVTTDNRPVQYGEAGRGTMDAMNDEQQTRTSALDVALGRVGDRWSFLIVEALLDGPRRFNDLTEAVTGIAPNILTDRLRRLERERVVVSRTYQERPPRQDYSLTDDGRELAGVLRLLATWGSSGAAAGSAEGIALRHVVCGSPLEAHWYCPTCARAVDDDDASSLTFA